MALITTIATRRFAGPLVEIALKYRSMKP